ncbi:MAG TPA: TlpA disulfide reductase family protein [Planctomycetaceae bacterium]|nr:TlpA disulfide reductase family protein [Planctomycetaceae bacterium]
MSRLLMLFAAVAFATPCLLHAQEKAADEKSESAESSPQEKLKADPNDAAAWNAYLREIFLGVDSLIVEEKFDEADQRIKTAEEFVSPLEPTEQSAKTLKSRFALYQRTYGTKIEVARTPLDELQQKLEANLDDATAFSSVLSKYTMQISPIARTEPEKAEALINDAKEYFASLKEKNPDHKELASRIAGTDRTWASYARSIETAKKHLALIGQDSPSIAAASQAWANGDPLSDSDLQGKVVMLDFWAVWCGPCIATFPHLREWKAKYGNEGFEIVGITSYYNYKWDEKANKAVRAGKDDPKVTPEEEQTMLKHFAELHSLTHPFAVQDEDRTLSKHFAVSGIPTAAVLDRKGKIRLIRVGSGDANARDIEQMIQQLLRE